MPSINLGPAAESFKKGGGKLLGAISKARSPSGKISKDLTASNIGQYKKGNWEENTPYTPEPLTSSFKMGNGGAMSNGPSLVGKIAGKYGMKIDSSGKANVPKPKP